MANNNNNNYPPGHPFYNASNASDQPPAAGPPPRDDEKIPYTPSTFQDFVNANRPLPPYAAATPPAGASNNLFPGGYQPPISNVRSNASVPAGYYAASSRDGMSGELNELLARSTNVGLSQNHPYAVGAGIPAPAQQASAPYSLFAVGPSPPARRPAAPILPPRQQPSASYGMVAAPRPAAPILAPRQLASAAYAMAAGPPPAPAPLAAAPQQTPTSANRLFNMLGNGLLEAGVRCRHYEFYSIIDFDSAVLGAQTACRKTTPIVVTYYTPKATLAAGQTPAAPTWAADRPAQTLHIAKGIDKEFYNGYVAWVFDAKKMGAFLINLEEPTLATGWSSSVTLGLSFTDAAARQRSAMDPPGGFQTIPPETSLSLKRKRIFLACKSQRDGAVQVLECTVCARDAMKQCKKLPGKGKCTWCIQLGAVCKIAGADGDGGDEGGEGDGGDGDEGGGGGGGGRRKSTTRKSVSKSGAVETK